MNSEEEYLNKRILELEDFILDVEETFTEFSNEIIDKVCKRAIKRMNKEMDNFVLSDDFPVNFTFFDGLSILYCSRSFDEMGYPNDMLEDYITAKLECEIDRLPRIEKLALYYSSCYESFVNHNYYNDASCRAESRFKELLDEHTSLVKIQKFLDKL